MLRLTSQWINVTVKWEETGELNNPCKSWLSFLWCSRPADDRAPAPMFMFSAVDLNLQDRLTTMSQSCLVARSLFFLFFYVGMQGTLR